VNVSRLKGLKGKQDKAKRKQHASGALSALFGVTHNSFNGHSAAWVASKVKLDRGGFIEYAFNEAELLAHVAGVKTSYEDGCTPVVLLDVEETFLGKVSAAAYAKAAVEVQQRIQAENPGKPFYILELMNEPYNLGPKGSNAKDYALICKATYEAFEAAKIPLWPAVGGTMLLVAAHLTYQLKVTETEGGAFSDYTTGHGWIRDFAEAWPEGLTKVNGWTSHPYGEPNTEVSHEGNNEIASAKTQHEQAVLVGFSAVGTNNWWVTEFGYNVGGGGFGGVATAALQASKLLEALEQLEKCHNEGWLTAIMVYADGLTEWGIWERPAAETLKTFAQAHG
jgi:hypothetical protein